MPEQAQTLGSRKSSKCKQSTGQRRRWDEDRREVSAQIDFHLAFDRRTPSSDKLSPICGFKDRHQRETEISSHIDHEKTPHGLFSQPPKFLRDYYGWQKKLWSKNEEDSYVGRTRTETGLSSSSKIYEEEKEKGKYNFRANFYYFLFKPYIFVLLPSFLLYLDEESIFFLIFLI